MGLKIFVSRYPISTQTKYKRGNCPAHFKHKEELHICPSLKAASCIKYLFKWAFRM